MQDSQQKRIRYERAVLEVTFAADGYVVKRSATGYKALRAAVIELRAASAGYFADDVQDQLDSV